MAAKEINLKKLKYYWPMYYFVLPSFLLVAVFSYYPAISAMYHAFFRWNGEDLSIFVGDRHFVEILGNYWLWIGVLISFAGILYTSNSKKSKSYFMRILASQFVLLITAGVMAVKGWAFSKSFINSTAESITTDIQGSSVSFGNSIIIWGAILLLIHLMVSKENDKKWFFLSIPILFLGVAFIQILGFNNLFAWTLVMLLFGGVLWYIPKMEKLLYLEKVKTMHAFISLLLVLIVLAEYSGGDKLLWHGFGIIGILVLFNVVKMVPSIITAVVIHRLKSDSANYWYRVLFVVPMIIPGMVILLLWKFFFNPNEGLLNKILINTHLMDLLLWFDVKLGWGTFNEGVMPVWLGDAKLVLPAFILWGFPWVGVVGVLIYLAGLQSIPESVYEASNLDGAGPIQTLLHIELPLILTQIRINMVLMIIGTLQSYTLILILFGDSGGPNGKLMVPGLLMFRTAFKEGSAGYACAIGLVIFFFILILTELNNRYIRVEE